ncbi:MAG: hypothetical protein QUS14_05705 [Pyrinomonadaceae bacterium]|nr:hypothetical protein [Pyrinomonadaceae bacterium]
MGNTGTIKEIRPRYAIPGGEISIECDGFEATFGEHACFIGGEEAEIIAASSRRVLASVPEDADGHKAAFLQSGASSSNSVDLTIGKKLASELHNVANPAVDPKDGSIIATRSGSRGYQLANTLFRIEPDGFVDALPAEVMNPTGIAFSPTGDLYVSNRAAGEVYRIERGEDVLPYASGLGVATGIAFDGVGRLYVGDRAGTIHRVGDFGIAEKFAKIEPSVAAYHIAFGPDGFLYVSAPGLASHDAIYRVSPDGDVEPFVRGFGRPQGLAFDREGNLYAAACYGGMHGIVRISPDKKIEHFVAGNNIVGLCFGKAGEMIIATNDSIYSLPVGIPGTLLP